MNAIDSEGLLRSYRKKWLFAPADLPTKLDYAQADIQRIIPHRSPFLFVDSIVALDRVGGKISGERTIPTNDPVFRGHFPDYPVYPGNLTIETIGQMGLCMHYFVENERNDIAEDSTPVQLRASRILGAHFVEPISPGDRVLLLAQRLQVKGFFASVIGQAIVNDKVAVVAIGEVLIL